MKKDFLSTREISKEELQELFYITERLKKTRPNHEKPLSEKVFALIFEKPSLRTRVTFETAIYELGGNPIYLAPQDVGLGVREAVQDVAQNLSRWVSGIVARVFAHDTLIELANYASIPVINALSDLEHPCQALADFFTIYEKFRTFDGLKFVWLGDGNNVCHSLMALAKTCGLKMWIAVPKGYEPEQEYIKLSSAEIVNDPVKAIKDADIVYTDVWASMGQESEKEKRHKLFAKFQVNSELLSYAKQDCIIMHCLPAHRGEEITSEVLDSLNSIVLEQAENRLHTQKAVLVKLVK